MAEIKKKKFRLRKGILGGIRKSVPRISRSRKVTAARAKGVRGLAAAGGLTRERASRAGAGRPKGSFKYRIGGRPVSVFEWRRFQAQRKQQLAQFQQQQNQRLSRKGFSPEQLQLLRQRQVIQRVQQGRPVMKNNIADEELAFTDHLAKTTVSPTTQQILVGIRRVQNKAKRDNIEQQRRHHERGLVGKSMNLMRAHENMDPIKLDFTGVSGDNILSSPSVFKENAENNILRSRGRNILNTGEDNTLHF